jgi:hypothetical protein
LLIGIGLAIFVLKSPLLRIGAIIAGLYIDNRRSQIPGVSGV